MLQWRSKIPVLQLGPSADKLKINKLKKKTKHPGNNSNLWLGVGEGSDNRWRWMLTVYQAQVCTVSHWQVTGSARKTSKWCYYNHFTWLRKFKHKEMKWFVQAVQLLKSRTETQTQSVCSWPWHDPASTTPRWRAQTRRAKSPREPHALDQVLLQDTVETF